MRRSSLFYVLVLLLFVAVAITGMVAVSTLEFGRRPWNAFDVVVVPDRYNLETVHRQLSRAGLHPIDGSSASLRIEDFNGQVTLPISEIPERFEDADPRVDPFVRAIPALFQSRRGDHRYNIIYIPRSVPLLQRYRELATALGETTFFLAGWQPMGGVLAAAAGFLILGGVAVASRRRIVLCLLIGTLAVTYIVLQGPTALVRGVLTGMTIFYALRRTKGLEREWLIHRSRIVLHEDQIWTLAMLAGSILASVVMILLDPVADTARALASYVFFLSAIAGLYGVAVLIEGMRIHRSEHRLFSPRPILGDPWRTRRRIPEVFPGMIGAAAVLAVAFGIVYLQGRGATGEGEIYIPVADHLIAETGPVITESAGVELLRAVSVSDAEQNPLSVAGFLAHRRYQSSFLYGGEYASPEPGETVTLRRFRREGARIEAWEEEQMRFDGAWVLDQYSPPAGTAYAIFVAEGGVFSVVREPLFFPVFPRELVLADLILLFMVVLPVLFRIRLPYRDGLGTVAVASRSERR